MIARFTTSDEAFLREARITCEPMPQPKPQVPEEELLEPSEATAIFAGMYRKEHARAETWKAKAWRVRGLCVALALLCVLQQLILWGRG